MSNILINYTDSDRPAGMSQAKWKELLNVEEYRRKKIASMYSDIKHCPFYFENEGRNKTNVN